VDWNSAESQELRFRQLSSVCTEPEATVGDYGAGYGALLGYLREHQFTGNYRGYDISAAMVSAARARYLADRRACFSGDEAILRGSDYVMASGIFNVKLATPLADWERYVEQTLDQLADLGRLGFSFNALTSYSDEDRMRPDLYYADPCKLFDRCKRRYSRHVALMHDYGLWEFTLIVRKVPA
jgi:hypothetical protein